MTTTPNTSPSSGREPRRDKLSLKRRLLLGFGAIAAAVALLSVAAIASLSHLGSAVATILRENYASVVLCEQMTEALERQDSAALFAATGRQDLAGPMLREQRARFEEALAREEQNITLPGEGDLVREIRSRHAEYVSEVDRALVLPPSEQQAAYFWELLPRFTAIKERVQSVARLNQVNMEQADRDAKQLARRTVNGALAVAALAVAFVLWFAWWLPRTIVRPLAGLTQSARAIGEGNLDVSVEEPETEELSALAATFNRMAEKLRLYRDSSLGELLAAKDLARSTLECMLDPVVVLDREGGVHLANEAAERAFSIRIGSAEELREAAIVVPDELSLARDRALESGAPVLPRSLSEAVHRHADAGERYYLVRAMPLGTAPKDKPSALVVAQDVTRFRRIDELKSDMVATVSHEFKTPLTSLRMATHLLLEPSTGELSEAQRELVTTARDDTERLRAMVEELLDVVRIEAEAGALHRVPIDPAGLLYEVADAHRALARDKGVALEVDVRGSGSASGPAPRAPVDVRGSGSASGPAPRAPVDVRGSGSASGPAPRAPVEPAARDRLVSVDPERLGIALANLVSNAIRHTRSGGRVLLRAARDDRALRIDVVDSGEGIAPELLPRVFDRSFTTSTGADGRTRHGLGLTIAREIVLQHGGDLRAESEPGKGSVFSLVLPIDAPA